MPSPMSPAPRTSTRRPASEPSRSAAMATAACDTEAVPRAMSVSVRARLPVSTAWRNSRLRIGPAAPSSGPVPGRAHLTEDLALAETAESSPAATANRWRMASPS